MTTSTRTAFSELLDGLASSEPSPAAGSAAAVAAATGAALLVRIVDELLAASRAADPDPDLATAATAARDARTAFEGAVEEDARAWAAVIAARSQPTGPERDQALAVALEAATASVREIARRAEHLLAEVPDLVETAPPGTAPDLCVVAHLLFAALRGAIVLAEADAVSLGRPDRIDELHREESGLLESGNRLLSEVERAVRLRIR